MQDRRGFIWVAGAAGLYRFDGNEAVPFRHPEQSSLAGSNLIEERMNHVGYPHGLRCQVRDPVNQVRVRSNVFNAVSTRFTGSHVITGG